MKKRGRPRLSNRKFDDPRPGYVRWTTQVREKLLKEFKKVADKENKTLIDAVNEALENWTYAENDDAI